MKIAIIGSHGTGKTTIINYLKKKFEDFYFYEDIFRELSKKLNYSRPREIVQESGISPFVAAALNEYSNLNDKQEVIFDQGPVVMLAYYYSYLSKLNESPNKFIEKLAQHYTDMIDFYIYLPTDKIPLISDEMRPIELDFQNKVDEMIKYAIEKLGIDKSKVYEVKSIGIHDRVNEVIDIIKELNKDGE